MPISQRSKLQPQEAKTVGGLVRVPQPERQGGDRNCGLGWPHRLLVMAPRACPPLVVGDGTARLHEPWGSHTWS